MTASAARSGASNLQQQRYVQGLRAERTQRNMIQANLVNQTYWNNQPKDDASLKMRADALDEVARIFCPIGAIAISFSLPILISSLIRTSNRTMLRSSGAFGGLVTVISCLFWYDTFFAPKPKRQPFC